MMGVGKIGGGGHGYYLEAVARGTDEYFRGVGEAPGVWIGAAAFGLGLEGDVDSDELRALWEGNHPVTGERLGPLRGRSVCGFDLTLKAPKSVSVLFALGSPEVSARKIPLRPRSNRSWMRIASIAMAPTSRKQACGSTS